MAEMVRYGVLTNVYQPGVLIDFYGNPITGAVAGVSSFNTRTGAVVPANGDYTVAQVTGAAPLASPALTGTPTAPTATVGTNTTQLATTAFVIANAGSGGGGIGTVLAQVVYKPTTAVMYTLTTSRTALDTTNLTTGPVTLPASGLVRVTVSCYAEAVTGGTVASLQETILALLNHSGGGRLGADEIVVTISNAGTSPPVDGGRRLYDAIVTGTPGASIALDVAGYVLSTSSGASGTVYADDGLTSTNNHGPVIITVYQA